MHAMDEPHREGKTRKEKQGKSAPFLFRTLLALRQAQGRAIVYHAEQHEAKKRSWCEQWRSETSKRIIIGIVKHHTREARKRPLVKR